jgi:hypothetical protein
MKTAFEILQSKLTIADTSKFRLTHIPEILDAMEEYKSQLPQQEISDEEIDNVWEMFRIQNPNTVGGFQEQYASFLFAIKWYREQLKTKKD